MKIRNIALILLLLIIFLHAQLTVFAEEYIIKPGDRLLLMVLENPNYNQTFEVNAEGKIPYFFEDIQAEGLTIDRLAEEFKKRLRQVTPNPVIVVSRIPKANEIFILGEVNIQNRYTFRMQDELNLLKAIALTGGILPTADLRDVKIIRSDGTLETHNLENIPMAEPVYLLSGDIAYVPKLTTIEVSGHVRNPGRFRSREKKVGINQALVMAGGPVQDIADLSSLIIYRADGNMLKVEVPEDFWNLDTNLPGHTLYDGDILYVPNAYKTEKIYILGYVLNPGAYRIKNPISPLEAIALAGGAIMEDADLEKIKIRRKDGKVELVDITKGQLNINLKLGPGDTLEIPKRFKIPWPTLGSFLLSAVSTAAIVYSVFSNGGVTK